MSIIFFIFSTLAILGALITILAQNTINSVFGLVLAFLASSVIWFTTQMEYLALLLVLVYVGAIIVIFVVAIMTIEYFHKHKKRKLNLLNWLLYLFIICLTAIPFMMLLLRFRTNFKDHFNSPLNHKFYSISYLGLNILDHHIYELLLVAILLTVALVMVIKIIGRRTPLKNAKSQNINKQVATSKKSRLKIIKDED